MGTAQSSSSTELVGVVLEFYEPLAKGAGGAARPQSKCNHRVVVQKLLATGGFADVYLARDTWQSPSARGRRRTLYAAKHMRVQSDEQLAAIEHEIAAHRGVSHPNVMQLLGDAFDICGGMKHAYLLFPYCAGGTVFDALEAGSAPLPKGQRAPLTEINILRIFAGAVAGVAAMHAAGIAHRDVKPRNLLMNGIYLTCVVTDLGSVDVVRRTVASRSEALALEEEAAEKCTAPFRAPELFQVDKRCVVDGRADVWSLGCVLYAMAFGVNAFESAEEGVQKLAILSANLGSSGLPNGRSHRGVQYSDAFEKLIRVQLQRDPSKRPTAAQLLGVVKKLETRLQNGGTGSTPGSTPLKARGGAGGGSSFCCC